MDNPESSMDNPESSMDNPESSMHNPESSMDNPESSMDNPETLTDQTHTRHMTKTNTQHRKLKKNEQHGLHQKQGMNPVPREG